MRQLFRLSAGGISVRDIATMLGIARSTGSGRSKARPR
ncbi:hypothetical protein [Mesorhizobium sp.]